MGRKNVEIFFYIIPLAIKKYQSSFSPHYHKSAFNVSESMTCTIKKIVFVSDLLYKPQFYFDENFVFDM